MLTLTKLLTRQFHKSIVNMKTEIPQMLPKFTYEQLKDAIQKDSAFVLDVREHNELKETGEIPGSINIPVGNVEAAFSHLNNEKFKSQYGKEKPGVETEIVVSCLSGKRSLLVQKILLSYGFQKVYNYEGGWSEWANKMNQNN